MEASWGFLVLCLLVPSGISGTQSYPHQVFGQVRCSLPAPAGNSLIGYNVRDVPRDVQWFMLVYLLPALLKDSHKILELDSIVLFHSTFSNGKILILCSSNQGSLCLSGLCEPNVPFSLNLSCWVDIICSPDVSSLLRTSLLSPTTWSPDFTFLPLVVVQSHPTLCDPMDCNTAGLPVLPYFPEFTQTHVHWVSDAIQPSRSLLSPSSLALNLSQHQSLFKCRLFTSGGQSIGALALASVLPMNIQG